MSIANDLALAISAQLEQITVANGYATDIGARVMRGRKRLAPELLPCCVIVERDDMPQQQYGTTVQLKQTFVLEGHVDCDPDNPNDAAHAAIADLKRAIFGDAFLPKASHPGGRGYTLNYAGRSIAAREDGMSTVACAIEVVVAYTEDLSNP